MKPEYIKLDGIIVNLSQIVSMRPSKETEDGDYVVNLSGTRQVPLSQAEAEPLWNWLNKQAVTPAQLA